ncbi:hypothetical protein BCR44DRAFT_1175966 [Catenaria anguillulae PL171]|uniref:Uncharacterized protein n=1 Tax=Catenaria anguillulae PL171 TaxID=765915 RepID=A0A1Y2I2T1_9FUNG|nr:hypothetical protein BCR44DRAFT_1175966 [Catenaria anguillulae PL171]
MFLAIQHCVKVNGPEQSGVGQIIHALLLHPKLPVAAWFLMIPALAQLCNCLESAGVPQWSSDNSIAHTLLSLILNPTAPTPSLTHPIHSTQTRLIIGFTVLSGYCSPEKITALYRALARATTTSFQQSTVDHWLFLFSVQSGNVQLVRHVLTLVRPRALAVSVAGRYVQRQSGAGWSQIGQELTQIQVDVGA